MPDARFSSIAERAQRMDGFAQTLEPVATAGRFKIMQSIADNVVYISQNGGAWTPLNGGGGGGTTLEDAYTAGSTINVIDGIGPVIMDSALTGGQTLSITSVGAVATGPLISDVAQLIIDTAGFDASVNAVTVYGIYADAAATALGTVSRSIGLFVRGPTAAVAKGGPLASQKYGNMLTLQNRGLATSSITNIVRNKSAAAGSLWFLGWDETNYEFATADSILTGQTHMVTLDGSTNVDAITNAVEFVNLRILTPRTTNTAARGITIDSQQRAGRVIEVLQDVSGVSTAVGTYVRMGAQVAATAIAGQFDWRGTLGASSGVVNVSSGAATALSGPLTGYVADLQTNVTAGAQRVNGVDVTLPASSNVSTTGYNVTGTMTAGRFLNGSLTATLTGTFVGCEIDCATGVNSGANQAIIGGRFQVAATSNTGAAGVSVISAQTAASCIVVAANGASGAPNGVKVTMATTISKTGQDGSAFFAAIPGAAACGVAIYPTLDGAYGQNALQIRREATITQSFTESTALVEMLNTSTFTAGTQTFNQPQVNCGIFSTVSGATHTWSGKILQVTQSVTRSSGTVTLSGRIASIEHSPTGTIGTDTTTGMAIVMTPSGAAAVVGQATVMQSNTSSAGCAAQFTWNSAAGTNGVTNNGIVNVYTGGSQNSGALTFLSVYAKTANLTLTGATTGIKVDLSTNVVPGSQNVSGISVVLPATTNSSATGINITCPFASSGQSAINITMSSGSSIGATAIMVEALNGPPLSINSTSDLANGAGCSFFRSASAFQGQTENADYFAITSSLKVNGTGTGAQSNSLLFVSNVGRTNISGAGGVYQWTGNIGSFLSNPRQFVSGQVDLSGVVLNVSHAPTGTINTDTTTGLKVTMTPTAAFNVVGVSVTMAANANGAAITIAHSGTNANQLVFTSAADGTGAHLSGPTGSTFLLRAGARTNSGTGRDVQIKGGAGFSGTDPGGNVLLSGGTPVSTGATGGVIATSMLAETSVALGNATGSPFNVDCSLGNSFTATTTGSTTWAFINPPASGYVYSFMLTLTNGGSQTQIWPASVKWPGGVAPALTVSGVDVLVFTTIDNGTTWRGVLSQSDSK